MDVVELVPAVPDLPFERAVLWLDRQDALPRRLEITEHGGVAAHADAVEGADQPARCPRAPSSSTCRPGVRVVDQ